jgi:isopenicillin N synthase-like dioxygenase
LSALGGDDTINLMAGPKPLPAPLSQPQDEETLPHHLPLSIADQSTCSQLIDFGAFLHGDAAAKQATAEQISHAFKSSGFLYLQNHGISPKQVDLAFAESAEFFKRPQDQKDALKWTTPDSNRGYVTWGREKVTQSQDPDEIAKLRTSNPDLKESMEIGREGVEGFPNQWPDKLDEDGKVFTKDMQQFFLALQDLHMNVMRAISLGMGMDEHFFDSYSDLGDNTLRLLHYPAVKKSVWRDNPNQVRAGEHSDYGSITLLFQDDIGGLEVKSPKGTWVRATPIPGTIVVNAGDLLQRWSNDIIRSTNHRVIQPPPKPDVLADEDPEAMVPARYSIAYFCNPNFDRTIEALPGTWEQTGKKYEGINSGDYLVMRLAQTY